MSKEVSVQSEQSFLATNEEELKQEVMLAEGEREQFDSDELQIPFLLLAQKQSGAVDKENAKYIEGLDPGHFYNNVASKSYGNSIILQVHAYFRKYNVYEGAEKQSAEYRGSMTTAEFEAFQRDHGPFDFEKGDFIRLEGGKTMRYRDTRSFLVSSPQYPEDGLMIMPLTSTGIRASKKWNSLYNSTNRKRYATLWKLETATDTKDGNSFKIIGKINQMGIPNKELLSFGESMASYAADVKKKNIDFSGIASEDEGVQDSEF